jgi:hypothetical protein
MARTNRLPAQDINQNEVLQNTGQKAHGEIMATYMGLKATRMSSMLEAWPTRQTSSPPEVQELNWNCKRDPMSFKRMVFLFLVPAQLLPTLAASKKLVPSTNTFFLSLVWCIELQEKGCFFLGLWGHLNLIM